MTYEQPQPYPDDPLGFTSQELTDLLSGRDCSRLDTADAHSLSGTPLGVLAEARTRAYGRGKTQGIFNRGDAWRVRDMSEILAEYLADEGWNLMHTCIRAAGNLMTEEGHLFD